MEQDLQKAGLWKRISAGIFDGMLAAMLAVGVAFLLSLAFGYDSQNETLNAAYEKYETQYGVTFNISAEQYDAMTEEEKANYQAAYDALVSDEEAMHTYNVVVNLMLLMTSLGILAGIVLMEFVVPLFRTVLGKFAIETMIPVYILLMLFMGAANIFNLLLLAAIALAQAVIVVVTRNNSLIHDLLAGTVVVDYASQRIFTSTQDLIEHQKRVAAERAAREKY